MSKRFTKSPRDTHGPVVKTGPTAGENRSRNSDGRWRAKRSDSGTSRSSNNGEMSAGEYESVALLIYMVMGIIAAFVFIYYVGFINIINVLITMAGIVGTIFVIKKIFFRNHVISTFYDYGFYNHFGIFIFGFGSMFFSVPAGIYILTAMVSAEIFRLMQIGGDEIPSWVVTTQIFVTIITASLIEPHYVGYFLSLLPLSIYVTINDLKLYKIKKLEESTV